MTSDEEEKKKKRVSAYWLELRLSQYILVEWNKIQLSKTLRDQERIRKNVWETLSEVMHRERDADSHIRILASWSTASIPS